MIPDTENNLQVTTPRFLLRPLTQNDVTETYLSWFSDESVQDNILAARSSQSIAKLKSYAEKHFQSQNSILWGIFGRNNGLHIGNIKYDPINFENGSAVMGILIGDKTWRGKKVAAEVILETSKFLFEKFLIRKIALAVGRTNQAAIRAYSKMGFVESSDLDIPNGSISMSMKVSNSPVAE